MQIKTNILNAYFILSHKTNNSLNNELRDKLDL